MKIKGFFLNKNSRIIEYLYTRAKSENLIYVEDRLNGNKHDLLIMTIVFNNFDLLKKQYKNLKRYTDFLLIVVDNSNINHIRIKNRRFCERNKIMYIGLPFNIFSGVDSSMSHGLALNWVVKNIVLKFKVKYFGFIDSDLFPIGKISILPKIIKNKGIYGLFQERDKKWYLWPGFCFFDRRIAVENGLNFLPCKGMDTGGRNFYNVFCKKNVKKIVFPSQSYRQIVKSKTADFRDTHIEIIDKVWVHLMNSSEKYDKKIKFCKSLC